MEWIFQHFVDIQTEWIFPTFKKTLAQMQLLPTQQYLDLLTINPPKTIPYEAWKGILESKTTN